MKVKVKEINGLKFYCRPNTSDEKTIDEVIGRNVYEKKGIKILANESWIDLGANIGAFTILAISKGAKVTAYEPDPLSFQMLNENLKLNGLKCETINKAVVTHNKGFDYLNISATGQYWRNSLERTFKGNNCTKVETINFKDAFNKNDCVKMDIEGSEMPIIEALDYGTQKLIFEWSFDIDDSLARYFKAVDKMKSYFNNVSYGREYLRDSSNKIWQKSWFPPYENVFCYQ